MRKESHQKVSMKKLFFAFGFVLLAGTLAYWKFSGSPEKETRTTNALRTPAEESSGYCIALRGNGELEPAHWGALARTVEQLGLPAAMSGGSSATISMFLMEAVAAHPLVQNSQNQKQNASLLLKSLSGFFTELQKTELWKDIESLYGTYQKAKNLSLLQQIGVFIAEWQTANAIQAINQAIEIGVLNLKTGQGLLDAIQSGDRSKASFIWQEIMQSIKVFGKFDAAGDANLFFRSGIISFEQASVTFGKIASFYAARNEDAVQAELWKKFFDQCAVDSANLPWKELIQKKPACPEIFHSLFQRHFVEKPAKASFQNEQISQFISVYPTTAVLTGSAVKEYRQAARDYAQKLRPDFGKEFRLKDPEDVRFGYWGHPQRLRQISQNLDLSDEKSRRFLPLGLTSWKKVLSLSPAEPGLSPLKEFTAGEKEYVSAGGWSDLHPVLVLKAAGCQNVVYITRQGGESLFAQGVAKRLLNLDRDWALLDSSSEKIKKLNNEGDLIDMESVWSKLYNMANPKSSIQRSLAEASAIMCTNWNAFDVTKQFTELIEDSYRSAYWINSGKVRKLAPLQPILKEKKTGCHPLSTGLGG